MAKWNCERCGKPADNRLLWEGAKSAYLCDQCNVIVQGSHWKMEGNLPYECPAKFYSGPGHQSTWRCIYMKDHSVEGWHEDQRGNEWMGLKGYE
jgi:hypothetical protein